MTNSVIFIGGPRHLETWHLKSTPPEYAVPTLDGSAIPTWFEFSQRVNIQHVVYKLFGCTDSNGNWIRMYILEDIAKNGVIQYLIDQLIKNRKK